MNTPPPLSFCYPGGRNRALLVSMDDGPQSDRRLVDLLNRQGLKGTFHLNTRQDIDESVSLPWKDFAVVYDGHEIACHGARHLEMSLLPREVLLGELLENRRALEELVQRPVRGLSYPFGTHSNEVMDAVRALGFAYARGIEPDQSMLPPTNHFTRSRFSWLPTCHMSADLAVMGKRFLQSTQSVHRKTTAMMVWGHSWECDKNLGWEGMERFCEQMGAAKTEIWSTTLIEFIDYLDALKQLRFSVCGRFIENPTVLKLWGWLNGRSVCFEPGSLQSIALSSQEAHQ